MDIHGSGTDIWGRRDQFRFVWKETDGDFDLSATLQSLVDSHLYAKAGLMFRRALEPDAALFMITVFPDGETTLAWRNADGALMEQTSLDTPQFPVRMHLRRRGDFLEAGFREENGEWNKTRIRVSEALQGPGYAGLTVLSHDNRCLTTASFRNIQYRKADGQAADEEPSESE